ncbi:11921_t:CDS:2, partial [Gigaspora margarita]
PIASDINDKLKIWYMIARSNYAKIFENGPVIKEAFEYANQIIPTLLTKIPKYSKEKLTSKLLNFQNLSNQLNSSFIPPALSSRIYDSVSQNFSISENIDYCNNGDND